MHKDKAGAVLNTFSTAPAYFFDLSFLGFGHGFGLGGFPNHFRVLPGLAVTVAEDFAFSGAFITSAHCDALLCLQYWPHIRLRGGLT
jgi:hypothetical protein